LSKADGFVSINIDTTSTSSTSHSAKITERTSTATKIQSSGTAFSVEQTVSSMFQTTPTFPTWFETVEITHELEATLTRNEGTDSDSLGNFEKTKHTTENNWSEKKQVTQEMVSAKSFSTWAGFTSFLTQSTAAGVVGNIDSVASQESKEATTPTPTSFAHQITVSQQSTHNDIKPTSDEAMEDANVTNEYGFSESYSNENDALTTPKQQSTENSSQKDDLMVMTTSNIYTTASETTDSPSISQVLLEVDTTTTITFQVPVTTSEIPETSERLSPEVPEVRIENDNTYIATSEVPTTTSDNPETNEPTLSSAIQVLISSTQLICFSYLRVLLRRCPVRRMSTLPI